MPPGTVSRFADYLLSTLRIVTGFLFLLHGTQKLFGFPGDRSAVEIFSQMGLAGVLETFGGLLMMLGLFTRPVAFILSGEMAWAYFQAHAPRGFWPVLNGGEGSALFSFVFLYFTGVGGGPIALDRLIRRA
jgi:putative oxidoreductase